MMTDDDDDGGGTTQKICRERRCRARSSPSGSSISTRTASSSPRACATSPRKRSKRVRQPRRLPEALEGGGAQAGDHRGTGGTRGRPRPSAEEVGKDLDPLRPDLPRRLRPASRSPGASGPRTSRSATCSRSTASRPAPCSTRCSTSMQDEGVLDLDDAKVLRIAPFDAHGHAGAAHQGVRRQGRLRARRPRTASRPLSGSRLEHVRPQHRQIHSGHHAPGRRRRWRRPAHQPAVLDVLPQDHRRSGSGTGTDAGRLPLADPGAIPVAHLGGRPRGHHRRGAARLHQRRAVPGAEGPAGHRQAGRPPPRRARRVRGRLQLHEVRPADAAGDQQDQRRRLQQPDRAPALRRHLRADPQRPADRRQRGRVLHAARRHRLHGRPHRPAARRNPVRSRLRHRRLSHLRHPPHARALREDGPRTSRRCRQALRAVEKKQLPHMLCVTNMLLHGIEDPSFVRHDNTLARPYISYTPDRPRRHRPHQSALRRARGRRHRDRTSRSTSAPARPPTCSSP